MPDEPRNLPVLNNSGKLDELRAQPAAPAPARPAEPDEALSPRQQQLRDNVIAALQAIFDPEIPVNIYDLGLIYSIDITEAGEASVKMTLTAPGCPVAATFPGEVQRKIAAVEGITRATVELVWDPPWTRDRMSESAMLELGLI